MNQYYCSTNTTCTNVTITLVSLPGPTCNYVVPATGNNSITASSGNICDHAGTGNYSNSVDGYTVIYPPSACQSIRLTFSQFVTEGSFDFVTIYDGVGTGGPILFGPTSGSPALPTVTSISGPITIRFNSDGSVVYAGFSAAISVVAAPASTLGSVSNPGPINFCDPGGNFVTPVTVSGQTGTVTWDWGSNNGVWNNNWLTGTSSGTCCFPKKTSNSDGNADRIRYRVSNAGCAAVTSGTILIVNRWNEAPTGLTTSASNYCANAAPPTITLTATFPTAINKNGTVAFYSGSCGGTLVGSVTAGDNTTSAAVTITAPTATTNYFVRYEPGAGTGCSNTACATVSVPVTPLPAAPSPVSASPTTICVGGTSQLNATSAGNTIQWYTVASGGASIGSSASGANFAVSPGGTTTYYAEASTTGGGPGNQTFNFTGGVQTFTVPSGVTSITVDAYGAAGYGALGYGGRVQSTHPVVPGEVLQIYVGGAGTETTGGFNGGGNAGANIGYGSGGGATDIRQGGAGLANRIMVAGGGGGTGSNCGTNTAEGGHGGGLIGMSGCVFSCSDCQYTGAGGTQVAGGTAGPTGHGSCTGNQNGSLGQGGSNTVAGYGTGGGGGYYGGGSGCFEGAGGGSSYTSPSASGVTHTQGVRIGNGVITLSWSGGGGCASATRTPVTVTVNANPTAANAGTDQTICATTTNLAGNTPGVGAGTWSIIAGAGGSLGAPTSPSSSFTGVAGTSYTLRWTISNAPCTASSDDVVITFQSSSVAPTSISGNNAVCAGSSTTLTLVGGSPGDGAVAQWFSGSCGGTSAGTGNSITVSPAVTTTYFVRYAGTCNTTGCASITVTVNTLSTPPTGISGTTSICVGSSTTLTATGGSLGTGAVATWYGPSACGPFTQDWVTQPYGAPSTTVNSVIAGILNVTSQNQRPDDRHGGFGFF
ncbi:MAG: CUB domain-containing protein [Bacteroidetes bacterium]|nr:CUB domain-containing protein [Bacteroidota bacterium]